MDIFWNNSLSQYVAKYSDKRHMKVKRKGSPPLPHVISYQSCVNNDKIKTCSHKPIFTLNRLGFNQNNYHCAYLLFSLHEWLSLLVNCRLGHGDLIEEEGKSVPFRVEILHMHRSD